MASDKGKELRDLLDDAELLFEGAEHAARSHWPILLIEGIVLIMFGVLAVFIPPLITIGIASSLGWVFVFGGIAALFVYFRLYRTTGFRQRLFLAVLSVIAGVALLIRPFSGIILLTVILIVGFALIGAAKLIYPLERMRHLVSYQPSIQASGVVDLVLAAWMFADLPATALWGSRAPVGSQYDSGRYCARFNRAVGTAEACYQPDRSALNASLNRAIDHPRTAIDQIAWQHRS